MPLVLYLNILSFLRFIDAQRLASWHEGTWGADRGPDPLEVWSS